MNSGRNIILSLVGDQTIPNVQFIKALPPAREYWFVETEKTKRAMRTDSIMEACGIEEKNTRILAVQPEALTFTPSADWEISPDVTLYINLTGGTKMMALSVYRFYEGRSNVKFYYNALGEEKSLPLSLADKPLPLPSLDLHTYLLAQGYLALKPLPLSAPFRRSKQMFEQVLPLKKPGDLPEINKATDPAYRRADKTYLT